MTYSDPAFPETPPIGGVSLCLCNFLHRPEQTLSRRIVRLLERRGLLIADPQHPSLDLVPDSSLDQLQARRWLRFAEGKKRPSTDVKRVATKRLSVDRQGRVAYQYKQPFRDGSTHVVLEPLDFVFRMNGMPRAQGCARAAMAILAALVPRRTTTRIDSDKPRAPMSWMQRLRRVFAMPQGTLS